MPQMDMRKLKHQVRQYAKEMKVYETYADVLKEVLKNACGIYAPLGIVDSRPKSLASFAEKAARKADKYDDPVHQLTDLCGARVIVNTTDELNAICSLIRREFVVDEANTDDAGSRLKEVEFGYRSFHFVVQMAKQKILGTPTRVASIKGRKAEIQVRTVSQHAWAAVAHDRLYKGAFAPPSRLKRLAHRAAALLEDADEALNTFEEEMQTYLGSYSAYMSPDDLKREIEVTQFVFGVDGKPATALRLARLLRAAGRSDQAVKVLQPKTIRGTKHPIRLAILVELGSALLDVKRVAQGCRVLEETIEFGKAGQAGSSREKADNDHKLLATAMALLAGHSSEPEQVSERYTDSLQYDPQDPYTLCNQLAYNLAHTSQPAVLDGARPAILRALETCRAHIDVGIQLPRAWFTMGRLLLLLRRDSESLDSYSKAIRFYLAPDGPRWPKDGFEFEMSFLTQVGGIASKAPPENLWARQLLKMGYWLKTRPKAAITKYVEKEANVSEFSGQKRIFIIAGGSAPEVQSQMESYRDLLTGALDRFEGVVISGGTTAGIPGLVGEVANHLKQQRRKRFRLIGYRPNFVRSQSPYCDRIIPSGQSEVLGLAEPLQMWLDLLTAGVDQASVRLLGINGGRISRFEYALALAMGALVGLVESSGRSADLVLRDPDWSKNPGLLPLPNDPMTAQAFSRVGASDLPPAELERMGRIAHEVYREGKTPNYKRPATLPWDCLPEQYKKSSRDQAAYAFEILRGAGFHIEKAKAVGNPIVLPERFVELMANQEHGRWNFERLESGWRRAPKKDDDKKLSPYIVPWKLLPGSKLELRRSGKKKTKQAKPPAQIGPQSIADYDRRSVRAFPRILSEGGYELKRSVSKGIKKGRKPRPRRRKP